MKNLLLNRFSKDEHGSITAFVLVLFLIMVVGSGMAVDFMRHETERAALQDAMDRGVLAAASFEIAQQFDDGVILGVDEEEYVEDLVVSYFRSNTLTRREIDFDVSIDIQPNSRRVSITGDYDINTFFLRIINIRTLNVNAISTAATARREVEVSLILDTTGSMERYVRDENGNWVRKIDALKVAAKDFIDKMLFGDAIDHTTMSLVFFEASVNTGPVLAAQYNLQAWHNYSYCFEFARADFRTTALSPTIPYNQEQHFMRGRGVPECPYNEIIPFSNNSVALKTAIDGMSTGGYTATYAGMKWGVALLDPVAMPVVSSLSTIKADHTCGVNPDTGEEGNYILDSDNFPTAEMCMFLVNPQFSNKRPAAWDDDRALKVVVLMTDGDNTHHVRVKTNRNYYFRYNRDENGDPIPWRHLRNADHWDNVRPPQYGNWRDNRFDRSRMITTNGGDDRLQDICDAARLPVSAESDNVRIQVYTIGFAISNGSRAYRQMRRCASDLTAFYHARDAEDLATAFDQIATSVTKLRLIDDAVE